MRTLEFKIGAKMDAETNLHTKRMFSMPTKYHYILVYIETLHMISYLQYEVQCGYQTRKGLAQ